MNKSTDYSSYPKIIILCAAEKCKNPAKYNGFCGRHRKDKVFCEGLTNKGKRCNNTVKSFSKYCKIHEKKKPIIKCSECSKQAKYGKYCEKHGDKIEMMSPDIPMCQGDKYDNLIPVKTDNYFSDFPCEALTKKSSVKCNCRSLKGYRFCSMHMKHFRKIKLIFNRIVSQCIIARDIGREIWNYLVPEREFISIKKENYSTLPSNKNYKLHIKTKFILDDYDSINYRMENETARYMREDEVDEAKKIRKYIFTKDFF